VLVVDRLTIGVEQEGLLGGGDLGERRLGIGPAGSITQNRSWSLKRSEATATSTVRPPSSRP
jgi:hypothetical protein